MATVLELITKKIEELEIGQISEYREGSDSNDYSVIEILDPRDYKEYFRLDDLGIAKLIKSCVIEVRDSECKIYYILDSSIISITLSCNWQPVEVIKELPVATIAYLRVLSAKKAPIELNIYKEKVHIIFEDTISKSPSLKTLVDFLAPDTVISELFQITDTPQKKRREKKEKPVAKKHILEVPLSDLRELDKNILSFIDNLDIDYELVEPFELPISVKDLTSQYNLYTVTRTIDGNFKRVSVNCGSGLVINSIECPTLVSKNTEEEITEELFQKPIEDIDDNIFITEEDISDIS